MKLKFLLVWVTIVTALVAGFGAGCGAGSDDSDSDSDSGANNSGAGNTGGNNEGGGGLGFNTGGNDPNPDTIQIEPQNFDLLIENGTILTQNLTATMGGVDVTAQVEWAFEKPYIGDVVGTAFTPTGTAGGTGKISATLGNDSGQAIANVTIKNTINSAGLTPEQIAQLDNPSGGADPAMALVYPYNLTVFPLDVLAPEIQWNGAGGGDFYKLSVKEKYYEYTEYFTAPNSKLIPQTNWDALGISGTGAQSDPVSVNFNRLSGGVAYDASLQTWRIAQGRLKGAVYYWELPNGAGNGRILKIKPSSDVAEQFYDSGGQCYGCHTVSRDGSKMMAALSSGVPFPQFTVNLTTEPAVVGGIAPGTGPAGTFSAFNDKGDRVIVSTDSASSVYGLNILDGNTGAMLAPGVMGSQCAEPAWSPDGTKLAAICNLNGGGWAFDATAGELAIADVAADGTTVTNTHTIVPQAGAQGRPAYPTFSPGSEYIAYGRPTAGSRSSGAGDIWLTDLNGVAKPLTTMSGDNRSFNPVFAPLRAGGYFWVVFISRRDYGNKAVGTNNQQLWVAAISDPPDAADPSQPPFYLRGQELLQKSENAYFALEPCKEVGVGCQSGVDCCGGTCIKDPATDQYICGTPSGGCVEDGNACEQSSDCCDAPESTCVDGFCTRPPPT